MRLIDADELITAFPCGESVRTESVRATINHLPTIEVSEDCSDYYKGYCARYEDGCFYQCKKAPSVVQIAEQYSTDGEVDLGDCNICRFAGCSECDDCINGSQWVRMTKEDEV